MSLWFYHIDNENKGPIPEESLRAMFESGLLGLDTFVWDCSQTREDGKWARAAETEFAITELVLNTILYIIAKSDKKHFSNGKLHKYLIILNKQYPIGITVGVNPQFKNNYVEQLSPALAILKNKGLISSAMKKGKFKATVYDALAPAPNLPDQLEWCLDKLLLEYDQTPGARML